MVDKKHIADTDIKEATLNLVFHALSDPSRRKMVELLREAGELKVGNLAKAFSMSLNSVSKHLKVLEKAGLIERRIKGREHFISVKWQALQTPYQWLHFYQHYWNERIDALIEYAKHKSKGEDDDK